MSVDEIYRELRAADFFRRCSHPAGCYKFHELCAVSAPLFSQNNTNNPKIEQLTAKRPEAV